jgi:hypothetical protein
VSVVIRSTLLQVFPPEHLLGRVSSVAQSFMGRSNVLGGCESGVAAKLLGTAPSGVIGGMLTLGVVGVFGWTLPALRRLGAIRAPVEEPVEAAA